MGRMYMAFVYLAADGVNHVRTYVRTCCSNGFGLLLVQTGNGSGISRDLVSLKHHLCKTEHPICTTSE